MSDYTVTITPRLRTRASLAQKLALLGTPAMLIAVYAILATAGSWWWLGALVLVPFLAANMSIVMHDVGHGLFGGKTRHWLLFLLGAGHMLSGHAFWATHSRHHRRFPADEKEDPEGAPARCPFREVMTVGMMFAPRLWLWAWRNKPGIRGWLLAELLGVLAVLSAGVILYWWRSSPVLLVYAGSLLPTSWIGYALVAWLSHQPHLLSWPRKQALAATVVGSVLVYFFGVIIFHEEHHAHEAVPSCNLSQLARAKRSLSTL